MEQTQDTGQAAAKVDDWEGGCPVCGNIETVCNIGPEHWYACNTHRLKWCIGANLFSNWKRETDAEWARNAAGLEDHRIVEPIYDAADLGKPIQYASHMGWGSFLERLAPLGVEVTNEGETVLRPGSVLGQVASQFESEE